MHNRYVASSTSVALLRALDAIKTSKGWTDNDLADCIGLSRSFIPNWRAGRSGPGADRLGSIRLFLTRYLENDHWPLDSR